MNCVTNLLSHVSFIPDNQRLPLLASSLYQPRGILDSALHKHGYYCRSRRTDGTARPRSCISCTKSKAGCDREKPRCLRCTKKAIECHYPTKTHRTTKENTRQHDRRAQQPSPLVGSPAPNVENSQRALQSGPAINESALVISDLALADFEGGDIDWGNLNIDLPHEFNDPMNNVAAPYFGSGSPSLQVTYHLARSNSPTIQVQAPAVSHNGAIPTQVYHDFRLFSPRPKRREGTQRTATLLFHTLQSYPHSMLQHKTLPSFIHPSLIYNNVENTDMEPLTNCISIVHMLGNGIIGSRKLFWRNVRQECERVCDGVPVRKDPCAFPNA